jgi:amino acid transporter/nucleotide-binding universal stress UspA family protein
MTTHNPPNPGGEPPGSAGTPGVLVSRLLRPAPVLIVSTVMLTFISYWRTAAVVLCDLASTAYYIGGIVESSIGKAAPFFILAVMLFSYAVRSVYIESCSLFVRGGVYRVVKEAMGGFLAKLSVSALMFDYILTGPTSGVSAGQYLMGLLFQFIKITSPEVYAGLGLTDDAWLKSVSGWGAVALAVLVTLYFYRQNLLGIHESSEKALKIMIATTIMAVVMLSWCVVTLIVRGGPVNTITWKPNLEPKSELATKKVKDPVTGDDREVWIRNPETDKLEPEPLKQKVKDPVTGEEREEVVLDPVTGKPLPTPKMSEAMAKLGIKSQEDPLGSLPAVLPKAWIEKLRHPSNWLSLIGVVGLFIAFGHSILAMSGEETLAQVYREVESPKLPNFKKAAFIVFVYSLVLTAGISFLAVMLIPDDVRMKDHSENLIGGLTRYVIGPPVLKLILEAVVVVIGFLILAGAVNTAIIGSNGVLNRVAEDGVMPDWFLKPHPRYGTTYRILWLICGLQIATIVFSGGDMILLGEAYAFGVVWSFVFKALAMVVLRFKDRSPREYKVPFNIRMGGVEVPFGLMTIFLILLFSAVLNFFTKEVATVGGIAFTVFFLILFIISEHYHEKRLKGKHHQHVEQFNQQQSAGSVSAPSLGLRRAYRKLVAIRSTQNLYMLEKALAETDPDTTDLVVMTAKVAQPGTEVVHSDLDAYDQELMTAVVNRAEKAGKEVKPLIVPTNNPLHAILTTARDLGAHELVLGASNKYTADEQLEQIAFYWINLHGGESAPLTVRMLTRERDMSMDLGGGNRIPKISERKAKNVAELRAAGVGVSRVLLIHDGTAAHSDLFQAVLTMLDPEVHLALAPVKAMTSDAVSGLNIINHDLERAKQLGRELLVLTLKAPTGAEIVHEAREGQYDLIVLPLPAEGTTKAVADMDERTRTIVSHAHCRVFLAAAPGIPTEVMDKR